MSNSTYPSTNFSCYRHGIWRDYQPRIPLECLGVKGDVLPDRTNGVLCGVTRIHDGMQMLVHHNNLLPNNKEDFAPKTTKSTKPRLAKLPCANKLLEARLLSEAFALLD
jgi:hypothetical protein